MLDVADVELHEVAVLAGDAVALGDLWRRASELGDLAELPGSGADAQHDAERVAECPRVELGAVAPDHSALEQPREALGDSGGGEADAAADARRWSVQPPRLRR